MDVKREMESPEQTVVAGRKPVLEALSAGPERVETVLLQKGLKPAVAGQIIDVCRQAGIRYRLVPGTELDRLVPGNHQGVAAFLAASPFMEFEELLDGLAAAPLPLAVVLDQVQDPGNVGALARTLYALGAAGLVIPKHGGARLGAGAMRASSGALARLPVARVTNLSQALDACRERGLPVYCAAAGEGAADALAVGLELPAVLVLGAEESGIRPGVSKRCDVRLAIPMLRPFDSLNVAQAGAILAARFLQALRGSR